MCGGADRELVTPSMSRKATAPSATRRLTSYGSAKAGWPDQNGGSACVAVPLIACFL